LKVFKNYQNLLIQKVKIRENIGKLTFGNSEFAVNDESKNIYRIEPWMAP
jgi:hypothetical protein